MANDMAVPIGIRVTGIVKWFNNKKGFGFIVYEYEDSEGTLKVVEVFVHHKSIRNNGGYRSLTEGQKVEFTIVKGEKGLQAEDVVAH